MSEIASHAWGVGETRGAAPVASGGHETGDVVSVIGRNEAYQGLLAFRGEARVDGDFRGDIRVEGTLWIGEHATVRGHIEADEVVIGGVFEGEIAALGRIELLATARVEGRLEAPRVAVREGGQFEGDFRAGSAAEAPGRKGELPASSP